MAKTSLRVLVVDDYEAWRRFACTTLLKQSEVEVVGEVSDGLEAVQQAQELQPDLILLDIGLPTLNGIEAARRIRKVSPASKLLFLSESRSAEIAEEALSTGAGGYVVKSDAGSQLLPAVEAVLRGKRFLSASVAGHHSSAPTITHSHEAALYADDSSLVNGYARFIASSLRGGKTVIVVVTESHRTPLFLKLEADGLDVPAVIEQRRYISLNAGDTLSSLTINDMPDLIRCRKVIGDLIMGASKSVQGATDRVAVCGEIAPTLLSKGNAEGAIQIEHLWDEITRQYRVGTLCGYLSNAFQQDGAQSVFQRICAEHSAVHGWEPVG